ncbi:MAG TPA: hypothetical protein PLD10_14205, partial [Rhodopila sp.]|nr:hypothetical protein [Rhodopila sp.]
QVNSGQRVRVITTDHDLYQLAANPRVSVTAAYDDIAPDYVRLYKTFVGDPNDKIPGVKGFGKKSFVHLNKALARTMLQNGHWDNTITNEELGLTLAQHQWINDNPDLLLLYWKLIGLWMVPMPEIAAGTKFGTDQPTTINNILQEFML